ncbi:MAG: pyridoxamine 5'-phosphate oxidase family protein [Xanthobacteraceae bacterium]|nr:MAG: pyridoxamine 5'-phosphate oxidase family protein [Xanthobacteraceae bacterium]
MKREFKSQIIHLLDENRILTIATNRADGWPQATVVGYANDGLIVYCFVARDGQKFANISRDPRVSLAVAHDVPHPLQITGLSIAAKAAVAEDKGEYDHAQALLIKRYPEYKIMPSPNPAAVALLRITPEIVSVLDYSKGFGHADLLRVSAADLAEFIESRRHHWASHPL